MLRASSVGLLFCQQSTLTCRPQPCFFYASRSKSKWWKLRSTPLKRPFRGPRIRQTENIHESAHQEPMKDRATTRQNQPAANASQAASASGVQNGQNGEPSAKPQPTEQTEQPNLPKEKRIEESPAYAAGRPWWTPPPRPVIVPDSTVRILNRLHQVIDDENRIREIRWREINRVDTEIPKKLMEHIKTLANSNSVEDSWASYVAAINLIASEKFIYMFLKHIPFACLHRLFRLLATKRPTTHLQYLRLLSVMTYIKHSEGRLTPYHWNMLLCHSASSRKTTEGEMKNALSIYKAMVEGQLPTLATLMTPTNAERDGGGYEPDIYILTTLLSIAARTFDVNAIRDVTFLMNKAGLVPNRITHLALLKFFTFRKNLGGVRRTLQRMRQKDLELGLDGLNACIWAYAQNGKLEIVMMIFRLLRHNINPETYEEPGDIKEAAATVSEEFIFVQPEIKPNHITFSLVIQALAYHGYFEDSVEVFVEMLSSRNTEQGAFLHEAPEGSWMPGFYSPTIVVYRALFLGFVRHAVPCSNENKEGWTLPKLKEIFKRFLALPPDTRLTPGTTFFIMTAFEKTSGNDHDVLRKAWKHMDGRFGIKLHKEHSRSRLAMMRDILFPPKDSEDI